jgi:hypothetical protein
MLEDARKNWRYRRFDPTHAANNIAIGLVSFAYYDGGYLLKKCSNCGIIYQAFNDPVPLVTAGAIGTNESRGLAHAR